VPRSFFIRTGKVLVHIAALTPAAVLAWRAFHGTLRPDPVERLTHVTGLTGLILLLVTLSLTPLRHFTGWNDLIRFRRMLGLWAFSYVVLHFLIYLVFEHFFSLSLISEDILERPYVTVGFLAFLLLIPLAVTSTRGWVRRLGGKRWGRLHQLFYVATALAILHFLWLVKIDTREPVIYALVLVALLGMRIKKRAKRAKREKRAKRLKG
jgi:sulfoxide reductase heme-binding subunit YedZ